jgi:GTP-binding protein HflX
VDAVEDRSVLDVLRVQYPKSVTVSARERLGLDKLAAAVADRLGDGYVEARVEAAVGNGKVFSFLSEHAEVRQTEYDEANHVTYTCRIPRRFTHGLVKTGAQIFPLNGETWTPNGQDGEDE